MVSTQLPTLARLAQDNTAVIQIEKEPAQQTVVIGADALFTITLANIGAASLFGVVVSDTLAPNCEMRAALPILAPGASFTYPCRAFGLTSGFTNAASVQAEDSEGNLVRDDDSAVVAVLDIGPSTLGDFVWHDVDADGDFNLGETGINGVRINLYEDSNGDSIPQADEFLRSATTRRYADQDGHYDFGILAGIPIMPKIYIVQVDAGNYAIGGPLHDFVHTTNVGDEEYSGPEPRVVVIPVIQIDYDFADFGFVQTGLSLEVAKTATPKSVDEPGGPITFAVTVTNPSTVTAVTLTALHDTAHRNLTTLAESSCALPQTIPAGASYRCAFIAPVSGNAFEKPASFVIAAGLNDSGILVSDADSAAVTINNVPSNMAFGKMATPTAINEPGGSVTYTVAVTNLSRVDSITIFTLTDAIHGNLNGRGGCALPQTIPVGGRYACAFPVLVTGNAGDVEAGSAAVFARDDDGAPLGLTDTITVTVLDVPSAMGVVKTATPERVSSPGLVTFHITVSNLSPVDRVTIDAFADDIYGDLMTRPATTCAAPQSLPVGASYTCSFTGTVAGNPGDSETSTLTVFAADDDGRLISASDDAQVAVVRSSIELGMRAFPLTAAGGSTVTFTVSATNTGELNLSDVVVNSPQASGCNRSLGALTVGASRSYLCSLEKAAATFTNHAVARGRDASNNPVEGSVSVEVRVVYPAVHIEQSVYLGHDEGASCPGVKSLTGFSGDAVTYCFAVTNLGDAYLDAIRLEDPLLDIDQTTLRLREEGGPLPPGVGRTYYYATRLNASLENVATVSAAPAEANGDILPGLLRVQDEDAARVVILSLAAVAGQVWRDVNGDGVRESSEASLPGVVVTLFDQADHPVQQQVSSGDGAYRFADLRSGSYSIGFTLPGPGYFFSPQDAADDQFDSDAGANSGRTPVFILSPGEVKNSQDAGIFAPPDLRIAKSDHGAAASLSSPLIYTLTYSNAGLWIATGVIVQEIVPALTRFDAERSTPGWSCPHGSAAGALCTFAIGALPAGSQNTQALIFAVVVDDQAPANVEFIENQVIIEDDSSHGRVPGNLNQDRETTPLSRAMLPGSRLFLPLILNSPLSPIEFEAGWIEGEGDDG
jgi:uncharacterized repeat protein (TIGR01451 family)